MKRNDWILATAVLLAAGVLGAYLLLGRQTGSCVMISKDNEEIGTYSLKDDRVIDVGDGNPAGDQRRSGPHALCRLPGSDLCAHGMDRSGT